MTSVLADEEIDAIEEETTGNAIHKMDSVPFARAIEAAVIKRLAAGVSVEPASMQFQTRTGAWCDFINDKHRDDTIADGTWPIRSLYTATAIAAARVQSIEACAKVCDDLSPDQVLNPRDSSFFDVTTLACSEAITRLLGKEAT